MAAYTNYNSTYTDNYVTRATNSVGSDLTVDNIRRAMGMLDPEVERLFNPTYELEHPKKEDVVSGVLCDHCHKFAFYATCFPQKGDMLTIKKIYMVDGYPSEGEMIGCQYCKKVAKEGRITLADFIAVDHKFIQDIEEKQ